MPPPVQTSYKCCVTDLWMHLQQIENIHYTTCIDLKRHHKEMSIFSYCMRRNISGLLIFAILAGADRPPIQDYAIIKLQNNIFLSFINLMKLVEGSVSVLLPSRKRFTYFILIKLTFLLIKYIF